MQEMRRFSAVGVLLILIGVARRVVLAPAAAVAAPPPPPVATPPAVTTAPPPPPPQRVEESLPVPPQPLARGLRSPIARSTISTATPRSGRCSSRSTARTSTTPAAAIAQSNAELLKKYPTWVVTLEGHCDERGTAEYNLALGERRAVAVKTYLVSLGIPPDRIRTVSYGKEFPFDPGHNEDAWAKNRRAHFVITSK